MEEYITLTDLDNYLYSQSFVLIPAMTLEVNLYVQEKYDILAAFLGTFEGG